MARTAAAVGLALGLAGVFAPAVGCKTAPKPTRVPFTGTRPVAADGSAASYSCPPGAKGNDLIFGDLHQVPGGVWTAETGHLEATGHRPRVASRREVPIATVWR